MAVTDETIRLAGDLRIVIDQHVDDTTRDLVHAWARAWQRLVIDWAAAFRVIREAVDADVKPTVAQVMEAEHVQAALVATRRAIDDLAARAGIRILQPADLITRLAADSQLLQIASQLPTGSASATIRGDLNRVDQKQIEAIVARTTQVVTSYTEAIGPASEYALKAELVSAIARGLNPRAVARELVSVTAFMEELYGTYTLSLNQAMVIARTELLDATRAAAMESQSVNAQVLTGWMWLARLDTRTCPSCWGQHGGIHPLDESGPDDHQQGRCARMPVVKSWKELGFAIPEPPSVVPDARQVFAGMSPAEQVAVMGPGRLAALQSGEIGWDQLSMVRHTTGWRRSFAPAPLSTLRRRRLRRVV